MTSAWVSLSPRSASASSSSTRSTYGVTPRAECTRLRTGSTSGGASGRGATLKYPVTALSDVQRAPERRERRFLRHLGERRVRMHGHPDVVGRRAVFHAQHDLRDQLGYVGS